MDFTPWQLHHYRQAITVWSLPVPPGTITPPCCCTHPTKHVRLSSINTIATPHCTDHTLTPLQPDGCGTVIAVACLSEMTVFFSALTQDDVSPFARVWFAAHVVHDAAAFHHAEVPPIFMPICSFCINSSCAYSGVIHKKFSMQLDTEFATPTCEVSHPFCQGHICSTTTGGTSVKPNVGMPKDVRTSLSCQAG